MHSSPKIANFHKKRPHICFKNIEKCHPYIYNNNNDRNITQPNLQRRIRG